MEDYSIEVRRDNDDGQIAQVLHPYWMERDDVSKMSTILNEIESVISTKCPQVELVLTGGGFIEFFIGKKDPNRYWRTEDALKSLTEEMERKTEGLSELLRQNSTRDYIIGVDARLGDRRVTICISLCQR